MGASSALWPQPGPSLVSGSPSMQWVLATPVLAGVTWAGQSAI